MDNIDNYKDLCKSIEIHELIIEAVLIELESLNKLAHANAPKDIKQIDYSGMPHGSTNVMSMDRIVERISVLKGIYEEEQQKIKQLKELLNGVNEKLQSMTGLKQKVAYMRDIEGKRLSEIAEELHLSEGYIKNISMLINRM